jgi:hypothetical protein
MKRAIFGFFVVLAIWLVGCVQDEPVEEDNSLRLKLNFDMPYNVSGGGGFFMKDYQDNDIFYLSSERVSNEEIISLFKGNNSIFKRIIVNSNIVDNEGESILYKLYNKDKSKCIGFFVIEMMGGGNNYVKIFWLFPAYSTVGSISKDDIDSNIGTVVPINFQYYTQDDNTVGARLLESRFKYENSVDSIKLSSVNKTVPVFYYTESMIAESKRCAEFLTSNPQTGNEFNYRELILFGDIEFDFINSKLIYEYKKFDEVYSPYYTDELEEMSFVTITD